MEKSKEDTLYTFFKCEAAAKKRKGKARGGKTHGLTKIPFYDIIIKKKQKIWQKKTIFTHISRFIVLALTKCGYSIINGVL